MVAGQLKAARFQACSALNSLGLAAVIQVHAKGKPLAPEVDLMQVARDLPGLSGAELANVLNEAALVAVRRDGTAIESRDIYNAMDRILQVTWQRAIKLLA
jgi:cell division protease FtsH